MPGWTGIRQFKLMPAEGAFQIQPWFVIGVGYSNQFLVDADPQFLISQFRPFVKGGLVQQLKRLRLFRLCRQLASHIQFRLFRAKQEPQPLTADTDAVLGINQLWPGVLYRNLGSQQVIVSGHTGLKLVLCLAQVAFLLSQVLLCQAKQLLSQQEIIEGDGDIAVGSLPEQAQLLVSGLKPHFGRLERRTDLAPGIERLGQAEINGSAVLHLCCPVKCPGAVVFAIAETGL